MPGGPHGGAGSWFDSLAEKKQKKKKKKTNTCISLTDLSWLPVDVSVLNGRLTPVQGVSHLVPNDSWNRLQYSKTSKDNGWMSG